MEGNACSQDIVDIDNMMMALERFRDNMGISEVHLTGGEPTLHHGIIELVSSISKAGFVVKMTTNGTNHIDRYMQIADAGLSELNVSMHTMDADALGAIMEPQRSIRWAEKAIETQMETCAVMSGKLKVKVNTCVASDESEAVKIAGYAKSHNLVWRPMNVLEVLDEAFDALSRMGEKLGAVPVMANVSSGSSACSVVMRDPDGFEFKVKLIRPFLIGSLCDGCPLIESGRCYEYLYGPRIEFDNGLRVRSCLHRQGSPYVLSVADYFRSQTFVGLCEVLRRSRLTSSVFNRP
ncbi:radical SAM protein [Candidatus Uhrbacteria bacterium]|nr:radical SAM protein [Candidatus Uhrbacteria bacterium]